MQVTFKSKLLHRSADTTLALESIMLKRQSMQWKGARKLTFSLQQTSQTGVLTPCHAEMEARPKWIQEKALPFVAELDGHTLGALCAATMALLTNRLNLCIQGLFGAGKSKSMAILLLSLLELDEERKLKILVMCKENTGTCALQPSSNGLTPR